MQQESVITFFGSVFPPCPSPSATGEMEGEALRMFDCQFKATSNEVLQRKKADCGVK